MIRSFQGMQPKIDVSAFVAETAVIIGDVEMGPESSIWYNCVLRGDINRIVVGARSNVQDGTIIHVEDGDPGLPVLIGARAAVRRLVRERLSAGSATATASGQGGRVIFDDWGRKIDVMSLEGEELNRFRTKLQFIFQDPFGSLNPRLSVGEIISEGIAALGVESGSSEIGRAHV